MTQPSRENLLAEGLKQARIHGVDPECARVYGEGWAQATRDAQTRTAELEADNERLVKHIKRANDHAKSSGEYARAVGGYRDEAWAERDLLRERIRKVREALHIADAEDHTDWQRGYRAAVDRVQAVLDEEGEKAEPLGERCNHLFEHPVMGLMQCICRRRHVGPHENGSITWTVTDHREPKVEREIES